MDDQVLRDYFDFDDTDLAANRGGKYSVLWELAW